MVDRVLASTETSVTGIREKSEGQMSEHNDSRSSSLSELEYGAEEREGSIESTGNIDATDENESEAETERLDGTPQKSAKETTRRPRNSRLSQRAGNEGDNEAPDDLTRRLDGSKTELIRATAMSGVVNGNLAAEDTDTTDTLNVRHDFKAGTSGRKRKRTGRYGSPRMDEGEDGPARKKSVSVRENTPLGPGMYTGDAGKPQSDRARAFTGKSSDSEDIDMENDTINIIVGPSADAVVKTQTAKSKKGKQIGRVEKHNGQEKLSDQADVGSAQEGDAEEKSEALVEEEDGSPVEDELRKKKAAMEVLGAVESQFATFRGRLYDEQIAQLNHELELLSQPNCTHPEYLAQMSCIDERRDEAFRIENLLLGYKRAEQLARLRAEQSQAQNQYVQRARDIREEALEKCGTALFKIQRGRRRWGADETEFAQMYEPKRSEQIRQQMAFNKEVSILSGIARHVGFPAAPDLRGLSATQAGSDLQAIAGSAATAAANSSNVAAVRQMIDPGHREKAAAEEQFLERTPWANPHHPAHHSQLQNASQQPRHSIVSLTTPAAQKFANEFATPDDRSNPSEFGFNPPSSNIPTPRLPEHVAANNAQSSPPFLAYGPTRTIPGPGQGSANTDPGIGPSRPMARSDRTSFPTEPEIIMATPLRAHISEGLPREFQPRQSIPWAAQSPDPNPGPSQLVSGDLSNTQMNRRHNPMENRSNSDAKIEARDQMDRVFKTMKVASSK